MTTIDWDTKDFRFQVKAVSEAGEFEGYASAFGNVDSYGERVVAGAFAKSLARHAKEGSMPKLLFNHNPDDPIGGWLSMEEDKKGLWGKGRILIDAGATERRVYSHVKAGYIDGLSIGYRVMKAFPTDDDVLDLIELDILEASIVPFPANRKCKVDAVKSERIEGFVRRLRDGDPPPIKEFEDILREWGVAKAMAMQIASVGYAKAIRSESEGKATTATLSSLRAAARTLIPQT